MPARALRVVEIYWQSGQDPARHQELTVAGRSVTSGDHLQCQFGLDLGSEPGGEKTGTTRSVSPIDITDEDKSVDLLPKLIRTRQSRWMSS